MGTEKEKLQRPAHRMRVKFVFHTKSSEMCFLIIFPVELQVSTLKFTSQGFITEFLHSDLVKNHCQVKGKRCIRPTECRSAFFHISCLQKVYIGQPFGWVHYLKLPWNVWWKNCSAYRLTMWNLQNLGYTAHKMQVSQIALHEIRQQANRKGNDVYSTLVLGLHTWYTSLAGSVCLLELEINLSLMFI